MKFVATRRKFEALVEQTRPNSGTGHIPRVVARVHGSVSRPSQRVKCW